VEISFSHGASQMADLSCGGGTETVKVSAFKVQCYTLCYCYCVAALVLWELETLNCVNWKLENRGPEIMSF
jgi:hypothetical protein